MLWRVSSIALVALLVGVGFHVSANPARACSCPATSTERELERANAVFRGEAVSIDSQDIVWDRARGYAPPEDWVEDMVEFRATEIWKGELYETIFVKTNYWLKDYQLRPASFVRQLGTFIS